MQFDFTIRTIVEKNTKTMLKRKALVTGGAGFIGSHLCEKLLAEGFGVLAMDNLSTGSRQNIQGLLKIPDFAFEVGNITDRNQMKLLISQCDIVYHLAAAVGVSLVLEKPIECMKTNIHGTEIILELCSELGKPVFIASSSEVYGKGTKVPFNESDDTLSGPTETTRWSYASSKAVDEFMALAYHREKGLSVIVARFFNTVGPRQSAQYGMVIPRLVKQAVSGEPMTVYGNGDQTRTFNHVLDTIDATYRLCGDANAAGKVFNIGGLTEISIRKLAGKIKARANSTSSIVLVPYEKVYRDGAFEDMPRRVPDLTRLTQQIGYKPRHSLDDIIDQVIHHETSRMALV